MTTLYLACTLWGAYRVGLTLLKTPNAPALRLISAAAQFALVFGLAGLIGGM